MRKTVSSASTLFFALLFAVTLSLTGCADSITGPDQTFDEQEQVAPSGEAIHNDGADSTTGASHNTSED